MERLPAFNPGLGSGVSFQLGQDDACGRASEYLFERRKLVRDSRRNREGGDGRRSVLAQPHQRVGVSGEVGKVCPGRPQQLTDLPH